MRENTVWIAPGATQFSCLCERCLDGPQGRGHSFLQAVRLANVRGTIAADTDVGFIRCRSGHQLTIRRIDRPAALVRQDARQLQLA
jgi:hypothetical protein